MPTWREDPERFQQRPSSDGHLVIFLNGILTAPGDQFAWTDRAEHWFLQRTSHDVDAYEYWQTPIVGRLFREASNVRACLELIHGYRRTWQRPPILHLVGHSRGCELARRLIVEQGLLVQSVHLFAAAVDADFQRNGFNGAIAAGLVQRICLYNSKADGVLKWFAGASLGLYGRLGYSGPRNVSPEAQRRIWFTEREGFGHSTWFEAPHFNQTMEQVAMEVDDLPW